MKKIRDVLRLTHAMGMSRRLVGEATIRELPDHGYRPLWRWEQ
ncbi:MAG: hypothetical protein ABSA13_14545 [Beijerinckiaceae bacterium]